MEHLCPWAGYDRACGVLFAVVLVCDPCRVGTDVAVSHSQFRRCCGAIKKGGYGGVT